MFSQNIVARDGEYTKTVYTLVNKYMFESGKMLENIVYFKIYIY